MKRDDLNGLGGGGNKLRKLEFLMGEALARGADTIITVGARQSNHARLTAAAAARAGLQCELVLTRAVPRFDAEYLENGNILLDDLLAAHVHDLPAGTDALPFAEARADTLRSQGRNVYVCPLEDRARSVASAMRRVQRKSPRNRARAGSRSITSSCPTAAAACTRASWRA